MTIFALRKRDKASFFKETKETHISGKKKQRGESKGEACLEERELGKKHERQGNHPPHRIASTLEMKILKKELRNVELVTGKVGKSSNEG